MERTGAVRSGWGMGSARRRSAVHQASTSVTKPRMVAAPLTSMPMWSVAPQRGGTDGARDEVVASDGAAGHRSPGISGVRTIEVKQLKVNLTPAAGLVNFYIERSCLVLPVQGKSDFDAIDNHRGEKFYKQPSVIGLLPSNSTLRQGMNAQATALREQVPAMIEALVGGRRPNYDVLPCYCLAVEIGTLVTDIGGTANRGPRRIAGDRAPLVGRAGVDHCCPLAAHIGANGCPLELSLRRGTQHSATHTEDNVEHVISLAQRQTIFDRKIAQRTPRDLAQIRERRLVVTDPVATSVRQHQVHSRFAAQRF